MVTTLEEAMVEFFDADGIKEIDWATGEVHNEST